LLRVHLGNPGGVGDLAIDANAPIAGSLGNHRSGLSDRPQVLAALIKASVPAVNPADGPFLRRRSLAEALASSEERAAAGASMSAVGDKTQLSAGQADPTGFEAIEDTVAVREPRVPRRPTQPLPPSRSTEDGDEGGESDSQQQAHQVERRAQASQASARQRLNEGRRATIPPPAQRAPLPLPASARIAGNIGRTTGRAHASVAPTAVNIGSPSRPPSSLRDRLLLVAAVGAASLAAVAIYGSSGAPTSAPGAAASGSMVPQPTAAALTAAVATATFPTSPTPELRPAEPSAPPSTSAAGIDPKLLPLAAPVSAGPPAQLPAARVPKGPRPKIAAGGTAKPSAWSNPYDAPSAEPLEQLVEERR
jgi:hypothetical protein